MQENSLFSPKPIAMHGTIAIVFSAATQKYQR
jgi:hypothetical protein